jgi:hypothetical protein
VHEQIGQRLPAEKPCSHLLVTGAKQSAGGGDEPHRRKLEATSHPRTELRLEWNGRGKSQKPQAGAGVWGIGRQRLHQSQTSKDKMEKIFRKIYRISREQRGNFYIFSLSWFSKNKLSNQNFREMYIWRRTPRWQKLMPPWGTTLGVTPTVGSTGRWGQVPAAVGHGGRITSAVAHGGRISSVVAHGDKPLAPCATAVAPRLYKWSSPCHRPLSHSSLTPPNLRLSTLRSTSEVCF